MQLPTAALVEAYVRRIKREIATLVSWKGGRFAHQRPRSIMDNAATAAIGYFDNAAIFRLAFILFSVGRSVFVGGSDIGPKILTWSAVKPAPRARR